MLEKICFKCSEKKSLDCFYKHSKMKDGYLNACKNCKKNDVKTYYAKNIKKITEYYKEREKTNSRKKWRFFAQKKTRKKNPEKFSARAKTKYAIRSGKLVKQPCEVCGDLKVHAHHTDYSKPLEIMWLCQKHHTEEHNRLKNKTGDNLN